MPLPVKIVEKIHESWTETLMNGGYLAEINYEHTDKAVLIESKHTLN